MRLTHSKNTIEPFYVDFEIYFTDDPKTLAKKLIKQNPDPAISNELTRDWLSNDNGGASVSAGMMGSKKDTYGIIAIFDSRLIKENTHSYFTHESGHILSHILLWTGAKYDPNNDEWTSYMLDYIFRLIENTYKKSK